MKDDFKRCLCSAQKKGILSYSELKPLSSVSTIGVGGEADFFVLPGSIDALAAVISYAKDYDVPVAVIGNASNVLFSDAGFPGAVICTKKIKVVRVYNSGEDGVCISAECGCILPALSQLAAENGLSGFEGLVSIPGTVGGAVKSNAGAYGQCISDCLTGLTVLTEDMRIEHRVVTPEQFSYRTCRAVLHGEIVVAASFVLKRADKDSIFVRMEECKQKRRASQPVGVRSAGSFFMRPDIPPGSPYFGKSAGELIQLCGLKGYRVGGAEVSEKHGNFIINPDGNATCHDILTLADTVKSAVFDTTGITLREEVACFFS